MKLTLDHLQIQGFTSFAGNPTVLDLNSHGPGLHYIGGVNEVDPQLGANGTGKSSLWNALCWCWYGRTIEGLRNPDVSPWNNKVKTRVETSVSLDGKPHVIVRTIAPNQLTFDGEPCDQTMIDRELGMPFDVFVHTLVFGQGQPLFFDLTPSAKMELFGTVLNLDRWDVRSKRAADAADILTKELLDAERKQAVLVARIEQLDQAITATKSSMAAWRAKLDEATDALKLELGEAEAEGKKLEGRRAEYDLEYDGAMSELSPLQKQIREVRIAHQRTIEMQKAVDCDTCPTCGQPIKGLAPMRRRVAIDLQYQTKRLEVLTQAETKFQQKADKAKTNLDYYTKLVAEANAKIRSLKERIEERVVNPFQQQLKEYTSSRDTLYNEHEIHQADIRVLRRKIERRQYWIKAFKDMRLEIVQHVLQELEITSNSMLQELGLGEWVIKYDVEKELKSGTIKRELYANILSPYNDKAVNWKSWSGGERQRLRLIGSLALAEVLLNHASVKPSLLVLDEPTAHLSDTGISDMVEMLAELARSTKKQVWYCDHRVMQSARFSSSVIVTKTAKGSTLT
jgi:DNA repair exonuclease SbcCD ATPase subunit